MDLLPLRLAAAGGTVDGHPVSALVAAGFTLLQRSPVLVRALSGRRAGILLPPSPAFLVALAAAEGRGAVLCDPAWSAADLAAASESMRLGAFFLTSHSGARLPHGAVSVSLDDAPRGADVAGAEGSRRVDLGSHFPLMLEGDARVPGRDEECLVARDASGSWDAITHRAALERAVTTPSVHGPGVSFEVPPGASWSSLESLFETGLRPLLAGARLVTPAASPYAR